MAFCVTCGNYTSSHHKFCGKCGAKMVEDKNVNQDTLSTAMSLEDFTTQREKTRRTYFKSSKLKSKVKTSHRHRRLFFRIGTTHL